MIEHEEIDIDQIAKLCSLITITDWKKHVCG
jgi:hypothetical protein